MKTKRVVIFIVLLLIFSSSQCSNVIDTVGHHVKATMYHPVKSQCSGNPLMTADGSKINLNALRSGKIRWIAVSRDLLKHYSFGDTVYVYADNEMLSGLWVIHDTMGPRHKMTIDFLMHPKSTHIIPKKVKIKPV